ncbi:MAG: PRC-barrel domain-containing protein [Rhodopirellula sp. JB044]|uniref:PRC-barrel domain-containing protein n=1 Tax=Rhodopirellula sp. JB044 TaxID=3342844 RepID=UPI00370C9D6C
MLISTDRLLGVELNGTDESVGSIHDLMFDDETWVVRHIVVDTGHWLPGRQTLLPPAVLVDTDWRAGIANVPLTRQQVKDGPSVESERPVSRQKEMELYQHYDVPYYWGPAGASLVGGAYMPMPLAAGLLPMSEQPTQEGERIHLRSVNEVKGYYIRGNDDYVGHVEEMMIDVSNWSVQQLVVDTRNWLPGKKVLINRDQITAISWEEATVTVSMSRDQIKNAPSYEPSIATA